MFDAVALCGSGPLSRRVIKESKALLEIGGAPSFIHVTRALARARAVDRIFLIGDRAALLAELDRHGREFDREVTVIEQAGSFLQNCRKGFDATIDGLSEDGKGEKSVLFTSGDAPFLTGAEVDQFIDGADASRYDYLIGMTPDKALEAFYPTESEVGVRMVYFHFEQGRFRQNNLHLVRPGAIGDLEKIEKMYGARYQRSIVNILKTAREFFRNRTARSKVGIYPRMLFAMAAAELKLDRLARYLARGANLDDALTIAGAMLGGARVGAVETSIGGAALDIDNERDYRIFQRRYDDWSALIEERIEKADFSARATRSKTDPEKWVGVPVAKRSADFVAR